MAIVIDAVVEIPQLPELFEMAQNGMIPIYDPKSNKTFKISASLLKGAEEVKNNWSSTTTYAIDAIVEFGLKFWKSLINGNIGNTPIEGSNWTEVSKSTGNGFGYWAAGVYTLDPSMVIRSGGLFWLDNTKVTFPFYSTDFEAEFALNQWVQLTGSGGGGGFVWDIVHIDSATTTMFNAVKNTVYLINATTAPVTAKVVDCVASNVDDYSFILYRDTHKVTITTVGGTQLIDNATSQIIPTVRGGLNIKGNGVDGYDITSDTRNLISIVPITANRDFGTDGFENNIIYQIYPNGGEITLLLPTAFALPGGIAIKSNFVQVGEGRMSIGAVSGNIGNAPTQVTNGDGQGFDIIWSGTTYSLSNDTRPKQLTSSLVSYPVSELSTINDPLTGTFFRQRVSTITDSRFDQVNSVESNVTITANPTDSYQLIGSSITDEGTIIGNVSEGMINILANMRRTGVNVNVYFQYLKRTSAGVETSLGVSAVIPVSSDTYLQYLSSAVHSLFTMSVTDRLIVRSYARKATTGTNPVLYLNVEGSNPTRSTIEVSSGSIAHNTLPGRDLAGAHVLSAVTGANIYNATLCLIGGLNGFEWKYKRALSLSAIDYNAAVVTSVLIGKNGATPSAPTFPYAVAANDVLVFAITHTSQTQTYLTLIGTYND